MRLMTQAPPRRRWLWPVCDDCGEDVGEEFFTLDGQQLCEDCFRERVRELLSLEPKRLAEGLGGSMTKTKEVSDYDRGF